MKRLYLLLLTISLIPHNVVAQVDYRPLLCEGRVWNEHADASVKIGKTLYLNGDTVIGGETYKKLYEHTTYTDYNDPESMETLPDRLLVPVMEKDRRVYAYIHWKKTVVYDFTLQPGDSLVMSGYEWLKVEGIDTISVKGELYRRFHVTHVLKSTVDQNGLSNGPQTTEGKALWVEGIGSDKGLTSLFGWQGSAAPYARLSVFDDCAEDGETVFTLEDFNAPAWKNPNTEGYHHPLVIEGKQWHEQDYTEIVSYDYYYAISGDTVIGGESYKKLFQTLVITPKDVKGQQGGTDPVTYGPGVMAFLQEHDGKVYRLDKYGHKGVLYDFSLNAGDIALENENYVQIVTKVDTILVNGRKLRRLWLTETDRHGIRQGYWVEGIGCNHGLEQPNQWPWPDSDRMRECLEDGNVIFTASDFESPALVAGKCATPTIAYDNGHLVFSCETTGAEYVYEIKCSDAGNGRGGEVSLSRTYEIRVHATLDGYQDSDVAVATIGWRNGRPVMEGFSSVTMDGADGSADVNGDGKVDVADIATVIDEMAR